MRASEIIKQLMEIIAKKGEDLDVLSWSDGTGMSCWQRIDMIETGKNYDGQDVILLNIDWEKRDE